MITDLVNNLITQLPKSLFLIKPFIITVKTDNTGTSNNDQFTLHLVSGGTYDFTVYSSDGTIFHTDDYTNNTITFNGGAGTYTLYITGILKGWSFNNGGDCQKLLNISQWGCFNPANQANVFYGCQNLTVTATDAIDLTGVTTLQTFFRDCKALTTIPGLRYWNTGNITQFTSMFIGCDNFNEAGVGYLNTSSATLMNYMFSACYNFNNPLPNFDTSNVSTFGLQGMFNNCLVFDQDISHLVLNPGITTLVQFLTNVTLSTTNYNALLVAWASQASLPSSITLQGGGSTYSLGDPATAKYDLITDYSWTITDGGLKYSQPLVFWNDFSDTSTISDTSGAVDSTADKSLNSVSLTATGADRPTTNSRTQNGLNVLDFDGANNYLTASTNDILDEPFTVFIVAQYDTSGVIQAVIGRQTGSIPGQIVMRRESGGAFNCFLFGSAGSSSANFGGNDSVNIHCCYFEDGGENHYKINNDSFTLGVARSGYDNAVSTGLAVGASRSPASGSLLDGLVGEIIIFNGVLTSEEIDEIIGDYLNTKWDVY